MASTASYPDVVELRRSPTSVFLQALALATLTVLASSHLASLRCQPRKFAVFQGFTTVIVPTYPFVEILIGLYGSLKFRTQARIAGHSNDTDGYFLCAAMDVRALPIAPLGDEKDVKQPPDEYHLSVPIHLIPAEMLEPEKQKYELRWIARFASLLSLAAMALSMLTLWIRRAHQDARTYLDDYVALLAFSILCITTQAIVISIANTTWRAPSKYARIFQERFAEPTVFDLLLNLTWAVDLVELRYAVIMALAFLEMSFWTLRKHAVTLTLGALYHSRRCVRIGRSMSPICIKFDQNDVVMASFMERTTAAASFFFLFTLCYCAFSMARVLLSFVATHPRYGLPHGHWSRYVSRDFRFGGLYLLCWTGLLTLSIWDLTNHGESEQWMWFDPWCNRSWDFFRLHKLR